MKNKKINKKAYKKLRKKCFFCDEDDYSTLQDHRINPGENGGEYFSSNVLVCCSNCHNKIHSKRIVIDKKYQRMTSPVYIVHYWYDGLEYWKPEQTFFDN